MISKKLKSYTVQNERLLHSLLKIWQKIKKRWQSLDFQDFHFQNVWDGIMDKEVDKEVNKVVDEDEANAVDKELNEGSELEDLMMAIEVKS